jgi:hypothetical protein
MPDDTVVKLFASNAARPQLAESDVEINTLKAAFEAAVIECEVDDDGDLYLSDGIEFPVWLSIGRNSRLIHFHTFFPDVTTDPDRVNALNYKYRTAQFAYANDRLVANYRMTYRFGADTRQIIWMARDFASICAAAMKEIRETKV